MSRRVFQKIGWRSHWQPFPHPRVAVRKDRCTCGDAALFGPFCQRCYERAPDKLRRELNFCNRMMKGSDRHTAAIAQVEQWLKMNPKP